jgi:predicted acyl esterase
MSGAALPVKSESVFVTMRDGVRLSAHIHRPAVDGKFPAILAYTPYRKGRLGGHHPIVEHGYATVTFDIRGTGDSTGFNDSIYSAAERQDGYDMVEWAAAQPWCSGSVGMWGISFGAVVSLQMARAAPPHLKAIIARSGSDDPYTEWTNPGGSPRPYMYECYAPIMTAFNFMPPDPAALGDDWERVWEERLRNNVPWGIPFIEHLVDGPFWRERSLRGHYDDVRCAVFVVGGWHDWYHTPLLRIFSHLKGPKRALIGPWCHKWPDSGIPAPRIEWLPEALKWFDRWLKGVENGVEFEPPLTIFVREYSRPATILMEERGRFRCESEWPVARRIETPMYFGAGGTLAAEPPADESADVLIHDPRVGACAGKHGGGPCSINWFMPLDQRPDEACSLTYTTEPLDDDIEVTGQAKARLYFSCTADVTLFVVKLCDVAPDGTSALVTKGYLNTSHRESHTNPLPLEPGKLYEVEVELLACAYRFARGHRIRVDVANADFQNVWPTPRACVNTVYRGGSRPSHIVLPMVPPRDVPLPEPALRILPPIRREDIRPPEFIIARDVINDTLTASYKTSFGDRLELVANTTVSAAEPARVVVDATANFGVVYGERDFAVKAHCVTKSDAEQFRHDVELDVTVNGEPRFQKRWSVSVPRPLA